MYKPGQAPVRIINHLEELFVEFWQEGTREISKTKLLPKETLLYNWREPYGKLLLNWTCGSLKPKKHDLLKDDIDAYFINEDSKFYFISFLNGMQRTILFTEDLAIATQAQQPGELERIDMEITFALSNVGISLVNNEIKKEISYISFVNSGVVWEEKKPKKKSWKVNKDTELIEAFYKKTVLTKKIYEKDVSRVGIDSFMFDFSTSPFKLLAPYKADLKRSFREAIWFKYSYSSHQTQFHAKIQYLQIDNQLSGCVFPVILSPVPLPKSVANENIAKPFAELSLMIRSRDYTQVKQIRYCKLLVQELSFKIDLGFISSLVLMFAPDELTDDEERELFEKDCLEITSQLMDDVVQTSEDDTKFFIDFFHFSPLKIHISFSLSGTSGTDEENRKSKVAGDILKIFIQSVGTVLSDIQDAVLKLNYFEQNYQFSTQKRLMNNIQYHYKQQALRSFYVVVFGLDVIGNPAKILTGFATGLEDLFYEPYKGAIQGPQEFAEGLANGVRSLFGHAVGGTAGAVSKITGTIGKGIAFLTLDKEYQKKRLEEKNRQTGDIQEGLASGGKNLLMGFFDGVTGIVRKPIEGAKSDGVEGFFKGVGIGVVGAFTRPVGGVVDFAGTAFDSIQKAADNSLEIRPMRPTRSIMKDGIVRPFNYFESVGNEILNEIEKKQFSATDQYVTHIVTDDEKTVYLLLTTKRILVAQKDKLFGGWKLLYQYPWSELRDISMHIEGIQLVYKVRQKGSLFSKGNLARKVAIYDLSNRKNAIMKFINLAKETMAANDL